MEASQLSSALNISMVRANTYAPILTATMLAYSIFDAADQAMFLTQIGYESGGLVYTSEIWGPTPAQSRYEGRADLGNVQPGDGSRYRGHGLLQITGRANHAAARDRMRFFLGGAAGLTVPDFEAEPTALTLPIWASYSAGDFWYNHGLRTCALDIVEATRRINGGYNGLAERRERWNRVRSVMGVTA